MASQQNIIPMDRLHGVTINIQGAEGTLYDGELFQLQFKFGTSYPFESPEVNYLY